jgi:hypothetical protein
MIAIWTCRCMATCHSDGPFEMTLQLEVPGTGKVPLFVPLDGSTILSGLNEGPTNRKIIPPHGLSNFTLIWTVFTIQELYLWNLSSRY